MALLELLTLGLAKGGGQALQIDYETRAASEAKALENLAEREKEVLKSIEDSRIKQRELQAGGNFVIEQDTLATLSGQQPLLLDQHNRSVLNPNYNGYIAFKYGTNFATSKQSINAMLNMNYKSLAGSQHNLFQDLFYSSVDPDTGAPRGNASSYQVKLFNKIKGGIVTNLTAAATDLRKTQLTQEGARDVMPNLYKKFADEIEQMKSLGASDAFIDDVFTSALGFTDQETRFYTGRNIGGTDKVEAIKFGSPPTAQEKELADGISPETNPYENVDQVTNSKILAAREIAGRIKTDKFTSVDVLGSASAISRFFVDGKIDYVKGDPRRNFKIIGGKATIDEVNTALKPIMALPSVGDRIGIVALAMPNDFLEVKAAGRGTAFTQRTQAEFENDVITAITGIDDVGKYQDVLTQRVKNFGTLSSRINTIDTLLIGQDPAVASAAVATIMLTVDAVTKSFEEAASLLTNTPDDKMSSTYQDSKKGFRKYQTLEDFNNALASQNNKIEKTRMLRYLLVETVFTIARTLENPEGKGARLSKSDIDAIVEATGFGATFSSAEQIMAVTKLLRKRMAYDLAEAEHLLENFNAENIQAAKFLRRQSGKASDPTFMLDFDENDIDSQKSAFGDFLLDLQSEAIQQKPVERDPVTGDRKLDGNNNNQNKKDPGSAFLNN